MHRFSLTDLQAFSAIADERNITKGAQRIHLSPSTVSTRIKELEQSLGTTLLLRKVRGVELTAAGEIVNRHAKAIERQIEAMHEELEPYVRREAGTVRISSNYGATVNFLTAGLSRFLTEHPDIDVIHERRSSNRVVERVAEGMADIGMCAYVGNYPGVEFIDFCTDDLVLVVPKHHRLARELKIDFKDCLNEEFVSLVPTVEMQNFINEKARELGKKITPRLQVPTQDILVRFVGEGVGVGIVSRVAYEGQQHDKTSIVKLKDSWARRVIRIVVPTNEEQRSLWTETFVETMLRGASFGASML